MVSVNDAIGEFLLACRADGLSNETVRWYASHVDHALCRGKPGERPITDVSVSEIRAHLAALRAEVSPHTLQGRFRAIRRFFHWCAAEYRLEDFDPLANIRYPRAEKSVPTGIDLADVIKLLAATGDGRTAYRNRAIILTLLDTGCRAGGLLHARPDDLNLKDRLLTVREKGDRARRVPFTLYTAAALDSWLAVRPNSEMLFCSLHQAWIGQPLTLWGLTMMLRNLKARAGVTGRVNPHSFRHNFARTMLINGADLATVSKLLGHSSIETTAAFYAIFTEQELAVRHEKFSPIHNLEDALR